MISLHQVRRCNNSLFGAIASASLFVLVGAGGCQSHRPYDIADERASTGQQIDRASALVRQAQRFEVAGDDVKAVEKYQAAIGEYREVPVAWNNLGSLLMKRGDNMAAAEAFKTASDLSPTDPRPLHNLGALWESLGYLDDAVKWYDQALTRDERYQPSLRRILLVQQLQNKPDQRTAERMKTALLIEKDPWWVDRLKRFHQRTDEGRVDATPDSMPK